QVAEIGKLVAAGKVAASKEVAKSILTELRTNGESIEQVAGKLGLIQSTDTGPIDAAIDELIKQNPKSLQDYRAGKQTAIGSLIGMIMKSTKGLNPKLVGERLKERLSTP
ncbi:MAG TPA: hypothetical protein PKB10_00270, partial [Tepidisphaeraceae bacterium]|nr:hypothetical protein [Tepidisphaeraceae bacterium]